jgi:phage protein D
MLRTKETAAGAASGLLALSQQQAIHGTAKLTGNPAVSLGQAVQFTDTPDSAVAAIYQVVGIRHQLSRASGFVTSVLVGGMPNV